MRWILEPIDFSAKRKNQKDQWREKKDTQNINAYIFQHNPNCCFPSEIADVAFVAVLVVGEGGDLFPL